MSLLVSCRFALCSQTRDLIVWDGAETLWDGRLPRKLRPQPLYPTEKPAVFQLGHDGDVVGEVSVIVAHNDWFVADCIVEDSPAVRAQVVQD